MANTNKFAVKNGLRTQNVDFVSPSETSTITMTMADAGTLSVNGTVGTLFSITNSFSGTIFSVNDVTGIPSMEVLDTGLVKVAQYSGNVLLGTGVDNAIDKLQVNGSISGSVLKSTVPTGVAPLTVNSTTLVTNLNANFLNGQAASYYTTITNQTGTLPVANGGTGVTTSTGSGSVVLSTSPTLTTPNLGTPSAVTLTNATGLPISGLTASTTAALGVGSIELGHATDTTIARSAAGVVTIEGVEVVTLSRVQTLTNKTLTLPAINNIQYGFTSTATAVGTTTLTSASNLIQRFTGTTTQTIVLPVTSTLTVGTSFIIENASTGNLTVNSSGGNLVATIIPGVSVNFICIGTTLTTAADWDVEYHEFASITGTGSVVLSTSPTLTTPVLGAATGTSLALTGGSLTARAAATQDGVIISGRAGGTGTFAVTLTPTTLSASRTVTLPDADTTIPVATQVITFSGPTVARTYTLPDSASTLAALGTAQTFTAAQTFRATSAIRSEAAATQDAIVLAGRAGGTGSFAVTLTPTTLTANRTVTLADGDVTMVPGTMAVVGTSQTFTAAQTFRAASSVRVEAAATQDAIVLAGRAGGTSNWAVTLTPTTLTANRTLTLPDADATVITTANGLTAGSTSSGFLQYSGTTATAGQINGSTTAPTGTTRLNYEGYLYATRFYGDGSQLTGISLPSGQTAGSATSGYLQYAGTTKTSGQLYGGTSAPTNTTRLNYDGDFYATNVTLSGALNAITKSFVIKHPTKPGKLLRYGSLESPYHGIRLTGEGVLIGKECRVELPEYITGLCKQEGVNVQITPYGHDKTLWVDSISVSDNHFIVKCNRGLFDSASYKFFWSFTAVRKDVDDMIVEYDE